MKTPRDAETGPSLEALYWRTDDWDDLGAGCLFGTCNDFTGAAARYSLIVVGLRKEGCFGGRKGLFWELKGRGLWEAVENAVFGDEEKE